MNHNILNKIGDNYVNQKIQEYNQNVYAYTLHKDDEIKIVHTNDIYNVISNDIQKNQSGIVMAFIFENKYEPVVRKYIDGSGHEMRVFFGVGLPYELISYVNDNLPKDNELHDVFIKFIKLQYKKGYIKITKFR